jgi:hypothetical protein
MAVATRNQEGTTMTESPTADAEDIEEIDQTRTNGKRAEMRPSIFLRKSSKADPKT